MRFGEGNSEEGIGKEIKSGGKKGNFQLGTEKFFEKKREKWREASKIEASSGIK